MSATASGADKANGSAKNRDHKQGNQDRSYTTEQYQAVMRVRRCSPTSFYDILDLESVKTTVTDTEIKKAYRKLSLLTHPDKNGHEHADEAFKMVSRAFGVLSDKDKRTKYDRFGGDPDSRFGGSSSSQSNPFAGGASSQAGGRETPMGGWDEEISPEEMFNRFFGGGMGGGFGGFGPGMFDTGPQFMFNLGGGPGIRVHQFGGARPRRRPREAGAPEQTNLLGLLPLLIIILLPLLNSLFFGGDSTPSGPQVRFNNPDPPYTLHRTTKNLKVDYYVNPKDVEDLSRSKLSQLDNRAEVTYVQQLKVECEKELDHRQRVVNEAQGWFYQDADKINYARGLPLHSCKKLESMGQIQKGSLPI